MFHPVEGVERLLLLDSPHSGIYDNDEQGTWTLVDRHGQMKFWGPDKRRFCCSYLDIISTSTRRLLVTRILVHAARRKRKVPVVTPTAALYRLGLKLGKDGCRGLLMSYDTFQQRFIQAGLTELGAARNRRWHKTLSTMHELGPVFEDTVPLGLVIGTAYPENTGFITFSHLDSTLGVGVRVSGITAVRVK